ncbi:Wadjet anti-phage system protein JetD domain-containing protein [Chryseobacterium sp. DT-3]|uniref:Wadjet anti-phage system protein JetD domain-containing protein n=1 Tax=Chryseobacterium sp. DT-3 TaxID=3396164 RepID=UPI003F19BB01
MISPAEIKKQTLKWWKPLLQSHIQEEPFFPKIIDRIGKVKSGHITERFEILKKEIEELYRYSKNQTGKGYLVQTAGRNFRRTGSHDLPDTVIFESLEDYLYFTGYQKDWKVFLKYYDTIISTIPVLKNWTLHHCLWLTDHHINWDDVLKVCQYFMETPRPNLYLRQLPIEIHTKFIEENNTLIQSLLDFLIPDHVRSAQQKRFAERFFLRYDEPLIRLRFLDENPNPDFKFRDISIPLSDFETLELLVENILITENKMNFLTLPLLGSTVAIWSGGGFNISFLKNAAWLSDKKIRYWGDIDEHGFQILHQLRSYHPHAQSVMMDRTTFETFQNYAVSGARNKSQNLNLLSKEENDLFQYLKALEKNRLEQEKIPQVYVDRCLRNSIES